MFAFIALVGQLASQSPDVSGYTSWKAASPEYVVFNQLTILCRTLTPQETEELRVDPHMGSKATVYVNKVGENAMAHGGKFPVGSVIVKRKRTADTLKPLGATVMIKREKGYDPKMGDWEFATLDADAKSFGKRGRLPDCATCHRKQAKSDFVFRPYVKRGR